MKRLLGISALWALCATLAACGGEVQGAPAAGAAANGMGGAGGLPGGGGASGAAGGGSPEVCTPGIPGTSQIPRLLNRQYEAVMRDLLGVTGVGADDQKVSELLVGDSDGPMTPDAWRIYLDVGAQIAREVMSGPNKSHFIACDPAQAGCLEDTIGSFGRKAFRRPLTDAEVARFQKLGETTPKGTPDEIAEATLQAFLVSPSFLMVPELAMTQGAAGQGIQLSSHEVAMRLSLLLWGSIPDQVLDAAADANQLTTEVQILTQAQRMIAVREKSGPLLASFHREWAQMNNQSGHWWKIDHDTARYPLYSPDKKPSWQAELDAFFEDVAFSEGTFADLLLSRVAFVNRDNAAIYGLDPAMFGAELTRTELDPVERPGFMTRAGFLSSYSGYDATSPILRGAFITVYMLGVQTGPPIPGATMMTVDGDFETQREYVEALTQPDACKGCHTTINPPGFALERFDAIGKLQTVDPRGGAIDAAVTTATVDFGDGKKVEISSPQQLMQEITQTPKALELYAQAWVAYAFGRAPNGNDRCVVEQLHTKLAQGDYSILDLLADLTQAEAFRLRARVTP
jgi:hypothetical protein